MKKFLLSLFISLCSVASAQTLTETCPAPASAGTTIACPIILLGGGNLSAGYEFTLTGIPAGVTATISPSSADATDMKTAACGPTYICIVYGLNETTIPDGPIAIVSYSIPLADFNQTFTLNIGGTPGITLTGASPAGAAEPVNPGAPAAVAVTNSPCDPLSQGSFTAADVSAFVNAVTSTMPASVYDLIGNGMVSVLDLQLEINAFLTGACVQ